MNEKLKSIVSKGGQEFLFDLQGITGNGSLLLNDFLIKWDLSQFEVRSICKELLGQEFALLRKARKSKYPMLDLTLVLRKRYGDCFFEDLEKMRTTVSVNAWKLSKKYPLSRERIRQIYSIIYNEPYSFLLKRKSKAIKEEVDTFCNLDPSDGLFEKERCSKQTTRMKGVILIRDKCLEHKIPIKFDKRLHASINEKKVCVRVVSFINTKFNLPYYVFQNLVGHDVYLLVIIKTNPVALVIPKEKLKVKNIYINTDLKGKYSQFINAWHLLKEEGK